jgi:DNA-binding response OmpR family regulator
VRFLNRNSTRYTVELSMVSESFQQPGKARPTLLVSSNPDVVDLYVLALRSARAGALSVSGGDEAMQLIRDRSVSAVIVDVANPSVDWDVCRSLLSVIEDGVPLIVLTGWIDADAREIAGRIGCAAFVAKPASPARLFEVLHRTRMGERGIISLD